MMTAEWEHYSKLNPSQTFYKGKEMFDYAPEGLQFSNFGTSRVPLYYRILFETGIYSRLDLEITERLVKGRVPGMRGNVVKENTADALAGSLVTLFYLCGSVIILGSLCFIGEARSKLWSFFKWCGFCDFEENFCKVII